MTPLSHYLNLESSPFLRLPPHLQPRNLELRYPVAFEMGMVTVLAVVIAAAWLAGTELRRWTWNYSRPVHYFPDIQSAFDNGAYGAQHGVLNVYDDQAAARANGDYRLDYPPLRLMAMTQWAAWRQDRHPYLAYNQPDYNAFAPMLYINTAMEFAAAVFAFFLVRHWIRRCTPHPKPRTGWSRGLVAALLIWFNPALIASGHAWPTWDLWVLPFFLLALWLACADRWFWSGAVLAVGAMCKGQELFIAPVFLLWPLFMLQPLRSLRWLTGFAAACALVLAPWLLTYLRDSVNPAAPHARVLDVPALLFVIGAAVAVMAAAAAARLLHAPTESPDDAGGLAARLSGVFLSPAAVAARKIAGGALTVGAAALLMWPLLLNANRSAVVSVADIALPLLPVGLGVVAAVMLAAMLLPVRHQGLVAAGALAVALLSRAVLFHGNFNALRIGWLYGTRHYPVLSVGVSDNLAALMHERYGWELQDRLPLLGLNVRQFLILLYALALLLCSVGMAVQERRNDARFLLGPVAAWLLFFCLLPQIPERYLLFAAVVACTLTAVGWGLTLLGLLLTAVAWLMTLNVMLEPRHDPALFGPHTITPAAVDRLYTFILPTHPDLAWAVLLLAAIFLFLVLSPAPCHRMIRGFLTTVLTFLWALWLGGIVALALNIATIAHVDRQILDIAGSAIFHHFMHYELTLAAMILGILLSWSLIAPARRKVFTFMIFLLAAAALAYNRFSIVPRMDALLDQHQTATVEFQRLHSTATHIYGYELALLILAGLLLPGLRRSVSPTTSK